MSMASDVVRAFPYPVWEEGNLSYPEGVYEPKVQVHGDGCSATISHHMQGIDLVQRLISEGNAKYVCSVSVPVTGYRVAVYSDSVYQVVEWPPSEVGEPPYLRPYVVCTSAVSCKLSEADGVSEAWIGRDLAIPAGAKLVLGPFFRTASSLQHLLKIIPDDTLMKGQLFVDEPCSTHGFYFVVKVSRDIYRFIQNPGVEQRQLQRRSILTHIVSCCFERLRRDYSNQSESDGGWRVHRNLLALAQDMENQDIVLWDDPDFIPEKAATAMYPHVVAGDLATVDDGVEENV